MKKLHFLLPLFILCFSTAYATHQKGGYITYTHQEGKTYTIILTSYASGESPVVFGNGVLDFGDGSSLEINTLDESQVKSTSISESVIKHEVEVEHTFPSNGTYVISYTEGNREGGTRNLEGSVNLPFYVESYLVVDDLVQNTAAKLQSDPLFIAYQNQTYHFNANAFDPDGDSLSFHLAIPKINKGEIAPGFTFPNNLPSDGSGTDKNTSFSLNPKTGTMIWGYPVLTGSYVIAFEVREWRTINGESVQVGSVFYDILVEVEEPTDLVQLIFPVGDQEVLLETGTPWETTIRAVAKDPNETVILQLSGDFLDQSPEIIPSDSVAGKGEVSITLRYTPSESAPNKYHLIASASLYSSETIADPYKSRLAYLLTPGYINGITDLSIKTISIYPNPASGGQFYLDYPLLNGKEVEISLFTPDGKRVFHKTYPSFSIKDPVYLKKDLSGFYLVLIQEGVNLYASKVILYQK